MFDDHGLHLRKVERTDLPILYLIENDDTMWASSCIHNPLSQQDLRQYLATTTGDLFQDMQLRLIVESEQEGVLGVVDLCNLDARNRKAEVSVYILPEYRQQHFGERALRMLVDYAFSFLQLNQLYAIIPQHNLASQKTLQAAHFEPTAILKQWTLEGDAVVVQILKENK